MKAGAIAFGAIVVSWVIYAVLSGKNGALDPVDLTVYRDGGLIVRHVRPYYDPHAGAPLYDWGGYSSLALKFTYTPFAAITFALISFIPWTPLWILSVIVNIAALVAALWFTFRALGYADRRVRLGATLVAAAVTFWLQPVVRTIYLGQVNLILMAAIIWDLTQVEFTANGQRRWWAGAVTGVAAGIKLVPLIFVPYLLLTKRFREAAMTVAGFLATVAHRVRDPAGRLVQVVAARDGLLRRQQDRVHGLGGQPVAARDHHPVRRIHQRRHQALAGRRLRRRRPRHRGRGAALPRRATRWSRCSPPR